ncbi:MAG: phosphopantetheine-binding protein [Clostridiales Family XIII bacterium]|jgi:acyl carrier protein|nr:phosphopantetheine-binding protein [Clostridiales Family XIII bacterium]
MDVFDRLKAILLVYAQDSDMEIGPDSDLVGDVGLNSFDIAQIVFDIEQEFDIPFIVDIDFRSLRAMSSLTARVEELLAQKGA